MAKTVKTTKRAVKATAKTAAVRKAMDKNIAKNVAKRAATQAKTPAPLKTFIKNVAAAAKASADKPTPITELDAFFPTAHGDEAIPTGKPASKPTKAGKAAVATTKPAKGAKPAKASAKPVTLAKAIAAKGAKPTAEETKGGPLVTGAKATIISLIRDAKGGVSAGEIAKKLSWPKAGGTISRAIKLAPFKVRKERVDGTLRYFAA